MELCERQSFNKRIIQIQKKKKYEKTFAARSCRCDGANYKKLLIITSTRGETEIAVYL